MADTPVYMIANFQIEDGDRYREYEKGFFPILKEHGGSFVTYDDNTETFEGPSPLCTSRCVGCIGAPKRRPWVSKASEWVSMLLMAAQPRETCCSALLCRSPRLRFAARASAEDKRDKRPQKGCGVPHLSSPLPLHRAFFVGGAVTGLDFLSTPGSGPGGGNHGASHPQKGA